MTVSAAVGFAGLHNILEKLVALLFHVEHIDDLCGVVPLRFHLRGFVGVGKVVFVPDVNAKSGDIGLVGPDALREYGAFVYHLGKPSEVKRRFCPNACRVRLLRRDLQGAVCFGDGLHLAALLRVVRFNDADAYPLLGGLLLVAHFLTSPLLLGLTGRDSRWM